MLEYPRYRHTRDHIYTERLRHIAQRVPLYRTLWSDSFDDVAHGWFAKNHPNPDSDTKAYRQYRNRYVIYRREREKQRFRNLWRIEDSVWHWDDSENPKQTLRPKEVVLDEF